jgi:hypothetical protein
MGAYWPFDADVSRDEWKVTAKLLKRACIKAGLQVDQVGGQGGRDGSSQQGVGRKFRPQGRQQQAQGAPGGLEQHALGIGP